MWPLIAGLGGKLLGLLALIAGLLAVYFGIKRKGTLEERGKWEKSQADAKAEVTSNVAEAVSKDSEIDRRVEDEKQKASDSIKPPTDTADIFKF